jgi:alkylation response protein AidB-like acyl-CoA dehydrogenase
MEITYQLTKKQDFFQRNINSFVNQKISPRVVETDRDEEFPREVMDLLAGNRLLGLLVPREEAGEGAGFLDLCLALEGIAKVCPTSALICSVQNLGARLLSKQGKEAQKERHLSDLMGGQAIFGYALPEVVSLNLTDVSLSVSKERDGFVLNGTECYVVNGDVAEMMCLFAKDEQSVYGFLAEKETQGLKVTRQEGTRGAEARSTCKAVLENCRIPADNLMGEEGAGQEIMADLISEASCFTAARALGIAQGALDYAIQYSKQREQFGLADMATRVEAARHLVYKAAAVLDQRGKERYRFSSIAKYFSSRMAMEVTADAVQVGGGYGYTKDYPLEKMMRNAQLNQILDGSNHSHQLAIAKSLLGDGFR